MINRNEESKATIYVRVPARIQRRARVKALSDGINMAQRAGAVSTRNGRRGVTMTVLPLVLTPQHLIEFLSKDKSEIYRALQAGQVPGACRAGKRWYIARDRFLAAATGQAIQSKPEFLRQ